MMVPLMSPDAKNSPPLCGENNAVEDGGRAACCVLRAAQWKTAVVMIALSLLLVGRCEERVLVAAFGGCETFGGLTSVTAMRWAAGLLWAGAGMGAPPTTPNPSVTRTWALSLKPRDYEASRRGGVTPTPGAGIRVPQL